MRNFQLLLLLLISPWSHAAESFSLPVYTAGFIDRQGISLSGEKFEPLVAVVAVGAWIYRGIGVELEWGTNIRDDSVASLSLEPESQFAIGVRLESEPSNGVAAYVLLSATSVSIRSSFNAVFSSDDEHQFNGFRGAFGLTFPFHPNWAVDAAFVHASYDDDFGINGFRVGARYSLNNARSRQRGGWFE